VRVGNLARPSEVDMKKKTGGGGVIVILLYYDDDEKTTRLNKMMMIITNYTTRILQSASKASECASWKARTLAGVGMLAACDLPGR
jgi:predicted oxidoreductase (fatty acid repression mutant protein)